MKTKIAEVLEVNKRQKEFYNSKSKNKNFGTRIWSNIRNGLLNKYRRRFEISSRVYDEHKLWLGDLSSKKVLDFGCLRGNALSLYMAKNAKEYVGIDLSDKAIADLNKKIEKENCKNAEAIAIDFLSDEFYFRDFDLIYAYGVLHHFEDLDMLISRLKEKLVEGGKIISYDPMQTSFPIRMLRTIYRPFQSDKDWEWPFNRVALKKLDNNFYIEKKRGLLGKSKYGILINVLPFSRSRKDTIIQKMIEDDWKINTWKEVYKCMHITMLLTKR